MKLIVGLGNPGDEYSRNRHNVGFMVLNDLQELRYRKTNKGIESDVAKFGADIYRDEEFNLVWPKKFMNKSGEVVRNYLDYYKIPVERLCVVHDDLDIVLGEKKIQWGKGPKVHNGLNSIERELGTTDFWRVRIGVDNRGNMEGGRMSGEKYVLTNFLDEEREIIDKLIGEITGEIERGWDGFI